MSKPGRGRVEVSSAFLFLMALLFYMDTTGVVWMSLLACFFHELGHWAMLRLLGNDVRCFSLMIFGAQIMPEKPMSYMAETAVAMLGPGVNLVLALLSARILKWSTFAGINLALAVFNLLPVGDLDGARILRCTLSAVLSDEIGYRISWCLDICFTVTFAIFGFLISLRCGNLTLLLMCLWLVFRRWDEKMSFFQKKNGKRGCQTGSKRLK